MGDKITVDYDKCPECGGDVKELIAYVRGSKTCDGYKCKECEWEKIW